MSTDAIDIRVRLAGGKVARVEADGLSYSIDRIGGAADRTAGRFARLRSAVGGFSGPMRALGEASRTAAVGLGMAGIAVAGFLGKMGFDYNKTLDSQRVAFTTFLRSGRRAAQFMRQLQALALKSPVLDPASTGEAARMLLAYGVSLRDVLPLVKAIGDMSAASGKSIAEVMPSAAMAIGQVASKGKLQAEELNQLAESVGLSRGRIREALRMNRREFEGSFAPGRSISADKALPAIRKAMEAQSAGAAAMLAGTTSGQVDRLREVVARGMGELTRGLYDSLGDAAGGFGDRLSRVDFRKVARDIGEFLRTGFAKAKIAFTGFMDAVRPAQPFFENILLPLLKGLAIGVIGSVIGALRVLVPAFRGLMIALGWVGEKAKPLKGVFQGVGAVIGFLVGDPVLKAIGVLGKFGGVFRLVGAAARLLSLPIRILGKGVGLLGGLVGRAMERIATAPGRALGGLRNGLATMLDAVRGFGSKMLAAGGRLGRSLIDGIKGALGSITGFGKDIYNAIATSINNTLPNRIKIPAAPDIPLPANPLPLLAKGGIVSGVGSWITGEAGPELNTLDRSGRVRVQPLGNSARVSSPLPPVDQPRPHGRLDPLLRAVLGGRQTIILQVDGREMTRVVAGHVAFANNRR